MCLVRFMRDVHTGTIGVQEPDLAIKWGDYSTP